MSYDNRLTAEQIGALNPGDAVVVQSSLSWREIAIDTGTVVRLTATQVVVSRRSRNGATYEDRFRRGDGQRVGAGERAELIDPTHPRTVAVLAADERRRRQQSIDTLIRRWSRNRDDLEALRELHTAIGEYLDEEAAL